MKSSEAIEFAKTIKGLRAQVAAAADEGEPSAWFMQHSNAALRHLDDAATSLTSAAGHLLADE